MLLLGFVLSIGYGVLTVAGQDWLAVNGPLSSGAARGLSISLVVATFAVMLFVILSFVVSNDRAERKLDETRQGLQRLLDSIDQGFVTLDEKGRIGRERSAVFDKWFARPAPETPFGQCLTQHDQDVGETFAAA